jgi:hypothetical protein
VTLTKKTSSEAGMEDRLPNVAVLNGVMRVGVIDKYI